MIASPPVSRPCQAHDPSGDSSLRSSVPLPSGRVPVPRRGADSLTTKARPQASNDAGPSFGSSWPTVAGAASATAMHLTMRSDCRYRPGTCRAERRPAQQISGHLSCHTTASANRPGGTCRAQRFPVQTAHKEPLRQRPPHKRPSGSLRRQRPPQRWYQGTYRAGRSPRRTHRQVPARPAPTLCRR